MTRVLLIEDEESLARIIQRVLRSERCQVESVSRGDDGLDAALSGGHDVLIVDRMLPGLDGMALLTRLRAAGVDTPALMLTALAELSHRVEGLNAGADDYLGKPFAFEELIARVRVLARRGARPVVKQNLEIGPFCIDFAGQQVARDGMSVDLTGKEFALLSALVRNRGRVMTRDELLERVWGYDADPLGNVVELYIHYLRRKLDFPGISVASSVIRTVRGAGYQFRAG